MVGESKASFWSEPWDKNHWSPFPMSFIYSLSALIPVLLEKHRHTHYSVCWIFPLFNRPLLAGLKWRWVWHQSGTQSGWRWRCVENSREELALDQTTNASLPTLPRAVKWKMAESLLALTHSRWVWQTPVTFIHHSSVFFPSFVTSSANKYQRGGWNSKPD